jgi:formamidopyrimidine-DNA glycosylase
MPELPEVETIRRELAPLVADRTLQETWAFPHPKFLPALDAAGATVTRLDRRGKYLLFSLHDDRELVVHLGMTGSLQVRSPADVRRDPYVRAWWALNAAFLAFCDVRRFGRLAVVPRGKYSGTLALQGPDALDPTLEADELWRALRASTRAVKTQLLSQRPLAGIGNIYADEALWLAKVHPARRGGAISRAQATALLQALRDVLGVALQNGGTTFRDYRNALGAPGRNQERLACYGRGGQPCLRCGTTLRRMALDARTTTWCPTCQRR